MLDDNIRLQINQAYQAYLVSEKKIEVYEKAVIQATENYRITKNKYDNALATTTELLDADVALLQTKLSVTNAKADSFLAYNKLLQIAGSLTN
jgi:outer membrane protein TolC